MFKKALSQIIVAIIACLLAYAISGDFSINKVLVSSLVIILVVALLHLILFFCKKSRKADEYAKNHK